jgi:hypothetical protein
MKTDQLADKAIQTIQQMSDEEKAELRQQLEKDCVLRKLLELRVQLTQRNYLLFAYWDDRTLNDLGPEERAELPEGFEDWPEDELKVN